MKYFIRTFGCQQNHADSERIAGYYQARGFKKAERMDRADEIVINSCSIRQSAEDRVKGLLTNLRGNAKYKNPKIVLTGCMVGMAAHDPTGKVLERLRAWLPEVDEFLPLEEVGFSYEAVRTDKNHAWIPISNGCNNFCTFCVVPFTRGREISRPFEDIVAEVEGLAKKAFKHVTLLGQNVNSYGADLVREQTFVLPSGRQVKPVYVKHLGRLRIPTLFPHLLGRLCEIEGIEKISFLTSNPWDFSDELIAAIGANPKVDRYIHLPVQSGDNEVLKRMNRWYTREEYLKLIEKIKKAIPNVRFGTDIIVGFCGETLQQFQNTVDLCQRVNFDVAYIAEYSVRPGTAAAKAMVDDVPKSEKNRRFHLLDQLVNGAPQKN